MRRACRRWLHFIATFPLRHFKRLHHRLLLHTAVKARCGNFDFRCEPEVKDQARDVFEKLLSALDLIQEIDPRRFRWIWERMPRFLILRNRRPQYWTRFNTCVLDFMSVRDQNRAEVAISIIHEAAHARLYQAGIEWWPDIRERIESRCIKEEIAFMRRLERAGWGVANRLAWYYRRLGAQTSDPSDVSS